MALRFNRGFDSRSDMVKRGSGKDRHTAYSILIITFSGQIAGKMPGGNIGPRNLKLDTERAPKPEYLIVLATCLGVRW